MDNTRRKRRTIFKIMEIEEKKKAKQGGIDQFRVTR